MYPRKVTRFHRVTAVMLSMLLLALMLPMTVLQSLAADTDTFTVVVTDGDSPVHQAVVQLQTVTGAALNLKAETDQEGLAVFQTAAIRTALEEGSASADAFVVAIYAEGFEAYEQQVGLSAEGAAVPQLDALLQRLPLQQARVSVVVQGEAALVEINGEAKNDVTVDLQTQVPVRITPQEGTYIQTLTVNGEPETVEKGQPFFKQFTVDADIVITATVVRLYTVSAQPAEGGKILINGQETASVQVDSGAAARITAQAATGYRVASLCIGDQETTFEELQETQEITVLIDRDTEITAKFVRVYTVTVLYDGTHGTVTTQPEASGGAVTVQAGAEVVVTADPQDNFRVAEVLINGKADEQIAGQNFGVDDVYTTTLTAQQDYEVRVTFAPNRYTVSATAAENGTVILPAEKVEHGASIRVEIQAAVGFVADSVFVNGEPISEQDIQLEEEHIYIQLNNVTKDQHIEATFKKAAVTEMDMVAFNAEDALRTSTDGRRYIYANGQTVTFSAEDATCIRLKDSNADVIKSAWFENLEIRESIEIHEIALFYTAEGDWVPAWHTVRGVSADQPLWIEFDETPVKLSLQPQAANEWGYYNSDVSVEVSAEDSGHYSGLQTVTYRIETDGAVTAEERLFEASGNIEQKFSGQISVDAKANNSDNVVIWIDAVDRAGNQSSESITLKINSTAPTMQIEIDGEQMAEAKPGNYNAVRTATITYVDRNSTFDRVAAENGIEITAEKADGDISKAEMIQWAHNGDQHVAKIVFSEDAQYAWSVSYTNKAGLSGQVIAESEKDDLYAFTIDRTAPDAQISIGNSSWDRILSVLTFSIFANKPIKATATATDELTGVQSILYYKAPADEVLEKEQLDELYSQGAFSQAEVTVTSDEKFVVYARVTDNAGNVAYVSTDGAIYDGTPGEIILKAPDGDVNGYYSEDFCVDVAVKDLPENSTATSGLFSVQYTVRKNGIITQEDVLYEADVRSPVSYDSLKQSWNGEIEIDAEKNNSSAVTITVVATDNAGNMFENSLAVSVNTGSKLKASIKSDDKPAATVGENAYYTGSRCVTVQITDIAGAFDADAAKNGIQISATDAKNEKLELTPGEDYTISGWELAEEADGLETYEAEIRFIRDGNYEWSFSYQNKAGNTLKDIETEDESHLYAFTVDNTDPTGSVSVNDNVWDKLLEVLTFGLYSAKEADVSVEADDATSPYTVKYFKTSNTAILTEKDLESLAQKGEFSLYPEEGLSIKQSEQFVLYLMIEDYAGNRTFLNTDGFILDQAACDLEIKLPVSQVAQGGEASYGQNGPYGLADKLYAEITVQDGKPYSGIQSIRYWVECDGEKEPTQAAQLFRFDYQRETGLNAQKGSLYIQDWDSQQQCATEKVYEDVYLKQEQLQESWSGTVDIDKALNNSSNVVLYVEVIDNAGNKTCKSVPIDIDVTAPTVRIEFDNNADNAGNSYFDAQRTATLVVTERDNHFNAAKALSGLKIQAVDASGQTVENAYTVGEWETNSVEGNPDSDTHTLEIKFAEDANYTWSFTYTDEAGNQNEVPETGASVAPFQFTVDKTRPEGTVTATSAEGNTQTWYDLCENLLFGFWSKEAISVTTSATDSTSPIASIECFKVRYSPNTAATVYTWDELDEIRDWQSFNGVTVEQDEQFILYFKISDSAGNYTYLSTSGLIVDHAAPIEETIAPEVTLVPEQPVNGFYNGDVKVNVQVKDPLVGDSYSGLNRVGYKVYSMGKETQAETLYAFDVVSPEHSDLQQTFNEQIIVDGAKNNSNDVRVVVWAIDNAGNASEDYTTLKIDMTAPTIQVRYDNNDADSNTYFDAPRTASIVVTERNFNPEDVEVVITNSEAALPAISEWTRTEGNGNLDNTKWTATVTFTEDGDYTFAVSCKDSAGWTCTTDAVDYTGNSAPEAFTIDRTSPTVSVTYDNNAAQNGNYFAQERVATIVITEHNLEPNGTDRDRVQVHVTATDDGTPIAAPTLSAWQTQGDRHTATIRYSADARYVFDIDVADKAGNASADFAEQVFFVDKTAPTLQITGVADHSANRGDVIPVISYSDTNFDAQRVSISLIGANRNRIDLDGSYADVHNGQVFTFRNFPREKSVDDIYTLSATLTDRAGNTTTQSISFSVNRFGSAYELSDTAQKVNESYQKTPIDIVLTEVNADRLSDIQITLFKNNETLVLEEGTNYRIDVAGGNGAWYRYTYTIFASNFAEDGVYSLSVQSKDAAGNVAQNDLDTKNQELHFGIDSTLPVITLENLESDTTYVTENMTVRMRVADNLRLAKVVVELDGSEYRTWSDDELEAILNGDGTFTFDITGGSTQAHRMVVYAIDAAGNGEKLSETELPANAVVAEDFYVTTNLWVRYYTNEPLFYGSIAGVVVLAGLLIFLVVYKRKKKEKEQ